MRKKEKEILIAGIVIILFIVGTWIYNNIIFVTVGMLFIICAGLYFWGGYYVFNGYQRKIYGSVIYDNGYKIIGGILMLLALVPGYLSVYILANKEESKQYLQEQYIGGILNIGKAALAFKKPKVFIQKEVSKEARQELIEINNQSLTGTVNN